GEGSRIGASRAHRARSQERGVGAGLVRRGSISRSRRVTRSSYRARANARRALRGGTRSAEHTSELQSRFDIVCRLLLETQKHEAPHCQVKDGGDNGLIADSRYKDYTDAVDELVDR